MDDLRKALMVHARRLDQMVPNPKMLRSIISLNWSNCNKPGFRGNVVLTLHVDAFGNRSSLRNLIDHHYKIWLMDFLEIHWVEFWKLLTQIQECLPAWQDHSLHVCKIIEILILGWGEWGAHNGHACTCTSIATSLYLKHTHWYTLPSWAWQLLLFVHLSLFQSTEQLSGYGRRKLWQRWCHKQGSDFI